MRWTIISTGIFTSFLFEPSFGVVDLENRTVTALGKWENEVTMTSAANIGRLTANIFWMTTRGARVGMGGAYRRSDHNLPRCR